MPAISEQNGVDEKHSPHGYGQKMISTFYLPESLFGWSIKTTTYILNRVLSKSVSKTPFE